MITRNVVLPARYLPYLDRVLDGLLQRIEENETTDDVPRELLSDDPPEVMMTLTIERPEPFYVPRQPRLLLLKGSSAA